MEAVQKTLEDAQSTGPTVDFRWLRAWYFVGGGADIGTLARRLEAARREKAPPDALFYSENERRWFTLADVDVPVRHRLEAWLDQRSMP